MSIITVAWNEKGFDFFHELTPSFFLQNELRLRAKTASARDRLS
jgi:hypothetical protein